MGIPLVDGRDIRSSDGPSGTAIVNQAFARRFFEGQNPVGRTFETMMDRKPVRTLITGYIGDARYSDMREPMRPTIYRPMDNLKGVDWATFVVRTKSENPLALASILKREIQRAQPLFRVANIRTQQDLIDQHTLRERLLAMLSMFFASGALALAGIGLYGLLSYSVLQRRREIGIRIALGARSPMVAWRIASALLPMIVLGAIAGLGAGLGAQRYLTSLLYEVKARDPLMLAAPAATILMVALLAALPPLIRAMRIDPAVTLRAE
jgi:ABC-type antimicrobial peptide transport system permease subunit